MKGRPFGNFFQFVAKGLGRISLMPHKIDSDHIRTGRYRLNAIYFILIPFLVRMAPHRRQKTHFAACIAFNLRQFLMQGFQHPKIADNRRKREFGIFNAGSRMRSRDSAQESRKHLRVFGKRPAHDVNFFHCIKRLLLFKRNTHGHRIFFNIRAVGCQIV